MGARRTSRATANTANPPARLNSWKEIAAYLDRDPRTVQLWETHEGLPVHRLTHHVRSSVYAFPAEIDAWLQARSAQKAAPPLLTPAPEPPAAHAGRLWLRRVNRVAVPVLVTLLAVSLWTRKHSRPSAAPPPASQLAVLPFQNQTSTDDQFADGLTSSVITTLQRAGTIPVVADSSVMELKGRHLSLGQITSLLHVSLLLQGTVAQMGAETQVTVELVDATRKAHLWGKTYTRTGDAAPMRQEEIASEIAGDVIRRLTGSAPAAVYTPAAVTPSAQ